MDAEVMPHHGSHVVQFYDRDQDLVSRVTSYLREGIARGQGAVVIATPDHLAMFLEHLHREGVDVMGLSRDGSLVTLDAAVTLETFMRHGSPDPTAFDLVIGTLVRELTSKGTPASAYGEMVALLWDQGNIQGALELERLWNTLLGTAPFSLLCAYPKALVGEDQSGPFADVCGLHTEVVDSTTHNPHVADELFAHTFEPLNQSAAAAREFVAKALGSNGYSHLIDDAIVVISELATNATVHTRKPFRVSIEFSRGSVRLEVRDHSRVLPRRRDSDPSDLGGRGLLLVEALTARWGAELDRGGKVVWAEFHDD